VRYLLSIALLEMRVALQGVKPRIKPPAFRSSAHIAWSGLLVPKQDVWMDIVFSAESTVADVLFGHSLGRSPEGGPETAGFMAEMARMIAIGLTRVLHSRAGGVHQPLMSRALRPGNMLTPMTLPDMHRSYDLVIENQPCSFVIATEPCPRHQLTPEAVRELDVLAGPFPPLEHSEVPMFKEGVVLTPHFIDKMLTHDMAAKLGECVALRRPTRLARYFHNSGGHLTD
jgi:hypothetical protein